MIVEWPEWLGVRAEDPIVAEAQSALARATTVRTAAVLVDQLGGSLRRALDEVAQLIERGDATTARTRIDRLLAKCGSHKSKVLSATIWVTDIRNRAPMNEVWTAWTDPKNLPARACVEAKLADPRALVEIMVTAAK